MRERGAAPQRRWSARLKRVGLALAAFFSAAMGTPPGRLPPLTSWAVFYGERAPAADLAAPDLLVLEPDHPWELDKLRRPGQLILAYLSLGEVHTTRAYFRTLQAAPGALLFTNPDWPGAWRVDPRSPAWRAMVLGQLAPSIRQKGYDGFFLDTVDTAHWLEQEKNVPGAARAMVALIADLKALDPAVRIVSNGGLDLMPALAASIDAIAVESVFTDYDFATKTYRQRDEAGAAERAGRLKAIRQQTGLPMLVIEYIDPADSAARERAARKVRDATFVPFVSDIGLTTLAPTP